jgi:hemoglobin/transferrin/lactoferrin receptor protein
MDIRTTTTGDPIMRGFAGFNLLALIDSNSLSTLWGEGGFGADDMYAKIDVDTVDHIEVVRGPNSVMYGSNALGGVINFITRSSPIDYTTGGIAAGVRTRLTYQSNMQGLRGRFETYGATEDVKWLVGFSAADYQNGHSADQELYPSSERNFDIRADWKISEGNELMFSFLDVYRFDQYRYYRPTQDNSAHRIGATIRWAVEEIADNVESFEWRVYYQMKRDERFWNEANYKEGYAQTRTYSTDAQASSTFGDHILTYGLHISLDQGESADDEQFTFTTPPPTKSDAPDTDWSNYALFAQDEWELIRNTLDLTLSARYDYIVFESKETSTYHPPVGDPGLDYFTDTTGALTGGVGLVWKIDPNWRAVGSWSRGFRQYAPNFGIRQLGNGVLIPNELLDPVVANNYEVGAKTRYPCFDGEAYGYYTDLNDWQELRPDTFQGQDWYDYNGNGEQDANENIVANSAVGSAYVYGFEVKGTIYLSKAIEEIPSGFSLWGGGAWNHGKVSDGNYFRHTQPLTGIIAGRWDDADPKRAAFVELVTRMVAQYDEIPLDRVENDLAYRRDPQNGKSPLLREYGGVPGYTVFSLYTGMNLGENSRLTMAVENFTNKQYRQAHSRMDALGINFILGIDVWF